MSKITPFIKLNDKKCIEAMNFYKDCFGGEVTFMTLGESPMAAETPKEVHDNIMHAELRKDGELLFSASDMMRDQAKIGDNVGITINCDSEAEIIDIFTKLSLGGEVFIPIEEAFWGAMFGVVTDKYGVEWMLNYQYQKN